MEGIDYFYSLDDWIKPGTDLGQILKNQVLVNIDVTNPMHSPKIMLDFSEVNAKITLPAKSSTRKATIEAKGAPQKSLGLSALNELQKNC